MRSDTAEYLYVVLQGVDLGFETDAVEDILLETEWYVPCPIHSRCTSKIYEGPRWTPTLRRRPQGKSLSYSHYPLHEPGPWRKFGAALGNDEGNLFREEKQLYI